MAVLSDWDLGRNFHVFLIPIRVRNSTRKEYSNKNLQRDAHKEQVAKWLCWSPEL
jgi:hypothetical protein